MQIIYLRHSNLLSRRHFEAVPECCAQHYSFAKNPCSVWQIVSWTLSSTDSTTLKVIVTCFVFFMFQPRESCCCSHVLVHVACLFLNQGKMRRKAKPLKTLNTVKMVQGREWTYSIIQFLYYVIKGDDRDQRNIHVSESCYFRDGDKRNLPTISKA